MIKFIDLFAGIGGLRLGFESALKDLGIRTECVLSSEIDVKAQQTYFDNFGEEPSGDIKNISDFPHFDFLLAGFPCQPFSYAGKMKGFGDTRGTLFYEIERILRENRPKGFLLENVRGLTSHDGGRTFSTIINALQELGYETSFSLLNSSDFGVPQNRVRVYIAGTLKGFTSNISIPSNLGAADSHAFKARSLQPAFFNNHSAKVVKDILEDDPDSRFNCSSEFVVSLKKVVGDDIQKLNGVRLIDYRNGQSIHSWELGTKGECSDLEISLMNDLIANRRRSTFGTHQDGKRLSFSQIQTFFAHPELKHILSSLVSKGYLSNKDETYNPVAGNMSFEVFKFLDPESVSITLVTSDAHKLGVVHNGRIRRITPRECARLQGFPDWFKPHPVDTHAYRQFGNSVSVPVVTTIVQDIFRNYAGRLNFAQPTLEAVG
jgi:DNA (cytosine-5)-methyltransferase 1